MYEVCDRVRCIKNASPIVSLHLLIISQTATSTWGSCLTVEIHNFFLSLVLFCWKLCALHDTLCSSCCDFSSSFFSDYKFFFRAHIFFLLADALVYKSFQAHGSRILGLHSIEQQIGLALIASAVGGFGNGDW